ncbi:MAG: M6 family metalloprotease domain-containing protein [Thermoplasmata archaeon]
MHRKLIQKFETALLLLFLLVSAFPVFSASNSIGTLATQIPWEGVFDFIPPNPEPIILTHPDGSSFEAYLTGAEIGGMLEYNGYTIIKDSDGYWKYGENTRNGLAPKGIVGKSEPPAEKGAGRTQTIWLSDGTDKRKQLFDYMYAHNRALGQKKYLALLMDFNDTQFQHNISYFQEMLSGVGTFPSGSLREFYLENSYGAFEPLIDVYGVFHSNHSMSYYSWDSGRYVDAMLAEILPQVDPIVNFAQYDNDGDGYVDMVIVIHAGPDAAATGNTSGNIWSHASWANLRTDDGVYLGACNTGPDVGASIGVYAHEMGHSIGEEDFYDITYKSMGTGDWELMAGGCWFGNPAGSNPMHFNPYSKIHQGWLTPAYINQNQKITLRPRELTKDIVQINISATQWFYVEYISTMCNAKFDRVALASGAIIWHLDTYGSQTDPSRYFLDVEEYDMRDGTQELQLNLNRGEPTDLWVDDTTGFSDATNPNTSANAPYTKSGIVFANFSKPGDTISFEVFFSPSTEIAIEKPVVENPCIYNTTTTISTKVYNNAPSPISNVKVSFYINNLTPENLIGNATISSIPAYGNASVTIQWVFLEWGENTVIAIADPDNLISETTKVNNLAKNNVWVYERKGQILIVDDDDGYQFEETYQGILDLLGYSWNTVKSHANASLMQEYDAVFWESGSQGRMEGQLSAEDIAQLKIYLNSGGKVWFSSPRLAGALGSSSSYQPGVDPQFLCDYLGALHALTLQSSGGMVNGVDELMSGLSLHLLPCPGRQMYDVINEGVSAYGDATPIFMDMETGKYIGSKVNGTVYNFKSVFTGFNLVQVDNGSQSVILTARILNWFGISTISMDRKTYGLEDNLTLTVRDWKRNQDPNVEESLSVFINSTSEPNGEWVQLIETDKNTGVFRGIIHLSTTNTDGALMVNSGDTIYATYVDGHVSRWAQAHVETTDKIPPVIRHTPLSVAYNHVEIIVNCFVFDNAGVNRVILHYRIHNGTYSNVVMEFVTGYGYYTAKIPADAVTLGGVDYYIEAEDINGNTACTDEYYIQIIEEPVSELSQPYAFISICTVLLLVMGFHGRMSNLGVTVRGRSPLVQKILEVLT